MSEYIKYQGTQKDVYAGETDKTAKRLVASSGINHHKQKEHRLAEPIV